MMTTMAALLGGVPLAFGTGTGAELRQPLGITIVGGLILSQILTLYTTPVVYLYFDRLGAASAAGGACAARWRPSRRRWTAMNISEPFIRRPVATSLLSVALLLAGVLAYRMLPVAPLPQVEFPVIQVQAQLPGASPETMASSVATPLERQFCADRRRDRDDVYQLARGHDDRAAVRPRPEHRRRRARRPGGHQRRARPAAAQPAEQSELSQGQPGRRARHDPGHDVGRSAGRRSIFDAADSIVAQKLSQVEGVGQVFVGGGARPRCGPGWIPIASPSSGSGWSRCGRARRGHHEPTQGRAVRSRPRRGASAATLSSSTPISTGPSSSRTATAHRSGWATSRWSTSSVEDVRTAGLAERQAGGGADRLPAARRQRDRDRGPRAGAHAAAAGLDSPGDQPLRRARSHHVHPGPRSATSRSRCCCPSCWWSSWCSSSCAASRRR